MTPSDVFSWQRTDVRVTWQSERTGIENKWFAPTGRVVAVQVEADGDLHIAVGNATGDKPGIVVCEVLAMPQWCEIRTTVLVGRQLDFLCISALNKIPILELDCEEEELKTADIRTEWEGAAPGWARWDVTIARWMEPATIAMLGMAGVQAGARVLDLASGAGSQTVLAAQQVGAQGYVVASDISDSMLHHVQENARAAGLTNVITLPGAAEDLDVPAETFDAAICRLGLMLFIDPVKALRVVRRALRPSGKMAVVVFTTPAGNPFLAKAMQILLRHASKTPPATGEPGLFSLGAPGVVERLFAESGFVDVEQRTVPVALRMPSAAQALALMQEALGALRAIVSDRTDAVRVAAWAEVAETLKTFETATGFIGLAEVLVAAAVKPA